MLIWHMQNKHPMNKTHTSTIPMMLFVKSIHYCDVIMSVIVSQITSVSIVYSTVCSSADQRTHHNSASLAIVRGIHRSPVNSPHTGPVTCKMFPCEDVIMICNICNALDGVRMLVILQPTYSFKCHHTQVLTLIPHFFVLKRRSSRKSVTSTLDMTKLRKQIKNFEKNKIKYNTRITGKDLGAVSIYSHRLTSIWFPL